MNGAKQIPQNLTSCLPTDYIGSPQKGVKVSLWWEGWVDVDGGGGRGRALLICLCFSSEGNHWLEMSEYHLVGMLSLEVPYWTQTRRVSCIRWQCILGRHTLYLIGYVYCYVLCFVFVNLSVRSGLKCAFYQYLSGHLTSMGQFHNWLIKEIQ